MHELQVTERILQVVLQHARQNNVRKVVAINLTIGELSDLENEWIQRYFDYLSKGTTAEGAKLKINRTPVVLQCDACSHSFTVNIRDMKSVQCPECSASACTLISGREYHIENMEVL